MPPSMTPLTVAGRGQEHPAARAPEVRLAVGSAIAIHRDAIARLRLQVMREWPCLFAGGPDEAAALLHPCVASWRSVAVLAFDGDALVGASTGLPLADEHEAVRAPFEAAGMDPGRIFLCRESMLAAPWRGRGIGHRFFDERESHARGLSGFDYTALLAVDRPDTHPRRPPFGRDSVGFWRKRGYAPHASIRVTMPWPEPDEGAVMHTLTAWLRPLERTR